MSEGQVEPQFRFKVLGFPGVSNHLCFFSTDVKSCHYGFWSGVQSSLEVLKGWRLMWSLLTDHKPVFLLLCKPLSQRFFTMTARGQVSVQLGIRDTGSLMLNLFGELLKKELGSGLMSSRTREGNVSSLFVVWQPESFLLLTLETFFFFFLIFPSFLRYFFCVCWCWSSAASAGCDLQNLMALGLLSTGGQHGWGAPGGDQCTRMS